MSNKSMKRKICIVTGSRAEYGLLYGIIKKISEDPLLELQLVVTGMHLSPEFGNTYKVIQDDGFSIIQKVEMLLSGDTPSSIVKSIGVASISFADLFDRIRPHLLVILGDRFELLAVAQAALVLQIPIAHIHGGEITEGAIDESIRHAITKMSHLHFVAAEEYRNRVVQLGENPAKVFNFGSPGLDNIHNIKFLSRQELEQELNHSFSQINFLITFHPSTLKSLSEIESSIIQLLNALESFPNANLFFSKSNADTFGNIINIKIEEFVNKNMNAKLYSSLGQKLYLSLMRTVDVVIGNSSSGLIEAPALNIPSINIGSRQNGRLKSSSVINSTEEKDQIISAIQFALSERFKEKIGEYIPYGRGGDNSNKIYNEIKNCNLENILVKKFFDIKN
jgi:UDP-hydrolysing UDP-N-acetyl-D-glucosamine 2-epimerase